MQTIKKTLSLGKVDYNGTGRRINRVTLTLELRPYGWDKNRRTVDLEPVPPDATELSITGAVWNGPGTDWTCGGQIVEEVRRLFRGNTRVRRICDIWGRFHLNGMKAGTRPQNDHINAHKEAFSRLDFYGDSCRSLEADGLLVDRGYHYGSAWLYEPLPAEVIEEVKGLFGVTDPATV